MTLRCVQNGNNKNNCIQRLSSRFFFFFFLQSAKNNCIQRCSSRFFFSYNLLAAPRAVSKTYAQVAKCPRHHRVKITSSGTSSAYQVQRVVCHLVRRDSSAFKFDRAKIAFIFTLLYWPKIQWQEKIRNEELWERAGQEPVAKQILRRKWGWIGHTLRKPASSTTRQALTWNPQGKRKRGRPRNSWRRDTEAELKQQGTNWSGMTRAAQNRVRWRGVVDGLCSNGSDGHK